MDVGQDVDNDVDNKKWGVGDQWEVGIACIVWENVRVGRDHNVTVHTVTGVQGECVEVDGGRETVRCMVCSIVGSS